MKGFGVIRYMMTPKIQSKMIATHKAVYPTVAPSRKSLALFLVPLFSSVLYGEAGPASTIRAARAGPDAPDAAPSGPAP